MPKFFDLVILLEYSASTVIVVSFNLSVGTYHQELRYRLPIISMLGRSIINSMNNNILPHSPFDN